MLEWLKGKKTYLVCIVGILSALVGYINGDVSMAQMIEAIFIAIGAMTMRAGVTKSSK